MSRFAFICQYADDYVALFKQLESHNNHDVRGYRDIESFAQSTSPVNVAVLQLSSSLCDDDAQNINRVTSSIEDGLICLHDGSESIQSFIIRLLDYHSLSIVPQIQPIRYNELHKVIMGLARTKHQLLGFGDVVYDPKLDTVSIKDKIITLTEKESQIMSLLCQNPSLKIAASDMVSTLWPDSRTHDSHKLHSHIYRLKQKLIPYGIYIVSQDSLYCIEK